MKEKSVRIVEYPLEKEEIKIPCAILKTKTIEELNKAISSSIPIRMSKFYERLAKENQ
ncbi:MULTISPECIES: hypothetical protein [unclassified Archaeoglobus]|jgi:hypothetical protein|uniref:hypothetical protein n=1 Tax=unclassified Archaeoglobus TaxID=2643606 RepID=UPI0025B7CBC0|nr:MULTISPECIES: hypothetical protein [unclassified Archaeoglobus]